MELVDVLVSAIDIPRGESAQDIAEKASSYLRTEQVPADQVRAGALTSIDDLNDLAVDRHVTGRLIPAGVQLATSDFVIPGEQESSALPNVDSNLFEMTIALEPQRVVGGSSPTSARSRNPRPNWSIWPTTILSPNCPTGCC